jgi:hypothetical protein
VKRKAFDKRRLQEFDHGPNKTKQKMKLVLVVIFLFALFGICMTEADAQARIKFRRGTYGSVVSGTLRNWNDRRTFVLKVREGQTLKTEQVGNPYITIFVREPSGDIVGDSDASCNDRREITPTVAGDYKIEVVECRKADPWRGRFRFRVTVR